MADAIDYRKKICNNKGCDDVSIAQCCAESGDKSELMFCQRDGYFFVKVNGRERLRTDSKQAAFGFFRNLASR